MDTKIDSQAQLPTDSIQSSGYPLGFMVSKGAVRPAVLSSVPARDVIVVEARQFGGHQKEAVVHEGTSGSQWRMVSDEGKHLKGTDLAPFPLGFFNAGIHADLGGRIISIARDRGITLQSLNMDIKTRYSLTGSFTRGDAIGTAQPVTIEIDLGSGTTDDEVRDLVGDALAASPVIAALGTELTNSFAIYVNGRRHAIRSLAGSGAEDAPDPFRTHARPPAPLAGADTLEDLIRKTGVVREGEIALVPAEAKTPTIRVITGNSTFDGLSGIAEIDTYLSMPGVSHFAIKADERPNGDQAPCGMSLIAASIVFCYMTQISRYIEHMKLNIRGTRIVQYWPVATDGGPNPRGVPRGTVEPVDTHLFFSGDESEEMHEKLMTIAARTCYLHATLITALTPQVQIVHNGRLID